MDHVGEVGHPQVVVALEQLGGTLVARLRSWRPVDLLDVDQDGLAASSQVQPAPAAATEFLRQNTLVTLPAASAGAPSRRPRRWPVKEPVRGVRTVTERSNSSARTKVSLVRCSKRRMFTRPVVMT